MEKHETIWTEIENFKNIILDALPVYDSRYIKIKIKTFGDIKFILIFVVKKDQKMG